jgi:hypothetical protein
MLQFLCNFLQPEKMAQPQFPAKVGRWDWQHSVTRICRCGHISVSLCETKSPHGAGALGMLRLLFGSVMDERP